MEDGCCTNLLNESLRAALGRLVCAATGSAGVAPRGERRASDLPLGGSLSPRPTPEEQELTVKEQVAVCPATTSIT